jgi:hypothetical protein
MRTLYKNTQNNDDTLLKKKQKNKENTLSTIYEFNTSSEFRRFMFILNYVDVSNTCTSSENLVSYHACFIIFCHKFIFSILIVYIYLFSYIIMTLYC